MGFNGFVSRVKDPTRKRVDESGENKKGGSAATQLGGR